jgi:chromosome partitioning protein
MADLETARRHLGRAIAMDVDLVVVDTPPALGPLTTASIREASLVIIPAMPGKESLERAHDVMTLAGRQPEPPLIRLLLTLAHLQSNLYSWMKEQVDTLYPGTRMRPVIPYEMSAGESALFEQPVTLTAPRSRAAAAYCDVAAEVLGRLSIEREAGVA